MTTEKSNCRFLVGAAAALLLPLAGPMAVKASVVGCFDGGVMTLRMINAADKPVAFTIEVQPPQGITLAEPSRKVELAVGTKAVETKFAMPRQDTSLVEGFYPVSVQNGAARRPGLGRRGGY